MTFKKYTMGKAIAPNLRSATDEERAQVQDFIDAVFPSTPEDMRKAAVDEALRGKCIKG